MELDLRHWRNSPAVVMWAHTANAFQSAGNGDPRELGMTNITNLQEQALRHDNAWQAIGMIKALDPVRPVYAHHGNDCGEVFTCNFYLNLTPLQEREEWMAYWAKNGKLPFIAIEFGPPLYASLQRDKDGYTRQGLSEPNLTQWMAVYLGNEAYTLEPKELRKIFAERYHGPKPGMDEEYSPHLRDDSYDKILWGSDSFVKFQNLFYRNTWRSWRTMGVSGMGVPWHQTDPAYFPELYANNNDTLAWIAGPAGESGNNTPTDPTVPAFTRKDHHFAPGETFQKQVVLINDARKPQPYSVNWAVSIGQKQILAGAKTGELSVGEKVYLPIDLRLPNGGDDAAGEVKLSAKIGAAKHADTFAFRVLAAPPAANGMLSVFDPRGETTKLLKGLGYDLEPWAQGPAAGDVVVIGAGALSDRNLLPGDLAGDLKGGGRAIVFGQENEWTRLSLQLRTAPHVSRRAFAVNSSHPVLAGLNDDDLRDWNGSGSLAPAYPYHPGLEWLNTYGWHWGNRGSISSCSIEKLYRSSFRPILEDEFDLAYSPLMEMEFGRGRLTICTLDFENRGQNEPAATRLLAQFMQYVAAAPITPKADVVAYSGDDAGAKILDDLGVLYSRVDLAADSTAGGINEKSGLLIVGGGTDLAVPHALTTPLKESLARGWNGFQPISDAAAALVKAAPGAGDGWQACSLPAYMESYKPAAKWRWTDGECVFRKTVDVPAYLAGRGFFISVGRVDESEETFINGTSVGKSRSWLFPRGTLHTLVILTKTNRV